MAAETLGVKLSLAPGLSVKNAYLYVILLILIIEAAMRKGEGQIELKNVHIPFIALLSYATLSWFVLSLLQVYPAYGMYEYLIALKSGLIDHYLVFLVFFYGVRSTRDALWVVKYMLGIVVLSNIITLVDVYDIPDLGLIHERPDGRVSGPLGESNQYAAFLILFLPGIAVASWKALGLKRVVHFLGLLASLGVLVLTMSRGAIVGLTAGSVLGTFYLSHFLRPGQYVKTAIAVTALTAITLIAIGYQYSDLLYARFIEQSSVASIETASTGRSEIWSGMLSKQLEVPITFIVGYGWDTYTMMRRMGEFVDAPHNVYLHYLFTLGIIGLALFLTVVINIMRVTKKAIAMTDEFTRVQLMAFVFGFLSLLIAISFVDLYDPWPFVWAYTGLMMRVAIGASAEQPSINTRSEIHDFSGTHSVLPR